MAKKTSSNPPLSLARSADDFFPSFYPHALTYDDVSLATLFSDVLPRETSLETKLSDHLSLSIPIISADMDTVTESRMAISMALNGGIGLIHYNMPHEEQVRKVLRVKHYIHGLITEPKTFSPDDTISTVLDFLKNKHLDFSSFPIVNSNNQLLGLLTQHVVKNRYAHQKIKDLMSPRKQLSTIHQKNLGTNPIAVADHFFHKNPGTTKLLIVNDHDQLQGLFTLNDIEQITEEASQSIKPARDHLFRLVCGVAISLPKDAHGELDKNRLIEHTENLLIAGADAIAISSAHAHTKMIGLALKTLRKQFKSATLIAGNVTSQEGVEFLADSGANCIKVGQGPGSICTTRLVAGVGIPQLTALYEASLAAKRKNVSLIADGGIVKSGDIVKALTLSNAVICGSLLAGSKEAPGDIVEINGRIYKQYRGMGSLSAMKSGSAIRYGHDKGVQLKTAAEGIEALKEISGPVSNIISNLIGGIQSGMGYLGAHNLQELQQKAKFVRVTSAGQKEASPHDVIELKVNKTSD